MRFDGAAALKLDFGGVTTTSQAGGGRAGLRLATPSGTLRGPEKYKVLEHRRRQAQILARRLLEMMEEAQ
jgi:hypothetical protein